jgi:hypothetical protein
MKMSYLTFSPGNWRLNKTKIMETISVKKRYVKTDGWRGYEQPIYAVCGANNTGNWSDSPCPSNVCEKEIKQARAILRANKIPSKISVCQSSNVFCVHVYLVVPASKVEEGKKLIEPIVNECRLLYIA